MIHFPHFPAFLSPFILALLCLAPPSTGHIILTFPEARYPPFDFLDSPRTLGPCGVPKSARSVQTNLQAGKMYKLNWRMAMEGENETIRLSLLNQRGDLVPNGVRGKNDADPSISDQSLSAEFVFPSECRNCTLLLEKYENAGGNLERSCAEIDVKTEELSLTQKCSDNGKWQSGSNRAENGQCQCAHGFSGEYCQNRDDCAADSDCGLGGKCVQDGVIQEQKSCFCQFGFFGTNCERRSDPDPADQRCFRHNGPSPNAAEGQFLYGLFNPECYQQRELEGGDRLYWRLLGNHLELLLDFGTNSWAALGWRPLQIPPTCRLFPQIESPEIELAKTSGFARDWLESPLHPIDCVDLVMGSVRDGSWLHIADMYSRDRSSPLKDAWLDGEESLSAAYGLQSQNRTILMFRRLVPEIEPTDHPLGPGPLFVIYAKGPEKTKANGHNGQWKYHGNETQNRGHLQMEFVAPSQMSRVRGPLIHLDSASAESTKEEKTTTTTETKTTKTTKTTAKLATTNSIQTSTAAASLNAAGNNKGGKLSKESKGIGSIWMRTKEREETEKSSTAAAISATESATKQQKEENGENGGEENAVELNEQRRIEFGENRQKEPMEENGHEGQMDGREPEEEGEGENVENGGPSNHVGPRESGEELEEEEGGNGRHSSFFSSSSGKMAPSFSMARLIFPFCWLIPSSWLILRLYG